MTELAALNAVACAEDCGIPLKSPAGALEFVCVALKKSVALKFMRVPLKIPLLALNKAPAPLMFAWFALNAEACAEDCGIPLKSPGWSAGVCMRSAEQIRCAEVHACSAKDPAPCAEQSASFAHD